MEVQGEFSTPSPLVSAQGIRPLLLMANPIRTSLTFSNVSRVDLVRSSWTWVDNGANKLLSSIPMIRSAMASSTRVKPLDFLDWCSFCLSDV